MGFENLEIVRAIAAWRGITTKQVANALREVHLHGTSRPGRAPKWTVRVYDELGNLLY